MTDVHGASDARLVPGRVCGTCDVCCVELFINEPGFKKPARQPCHHLRPGAGCAVYENRPATCRSYNCGWRYHQWVKQGLRPDLSGVLVMSRKDRDGTGRTGVAFLLMSKAAVSADGLAESVAAAVHGGLPVWLDVLGPPGHTGASTRIEQLLRDPVQAKNKAAVSRILRQTWERTVRNGNNGQFIRLQEQSDPVATDADNPPSRAPDDTLA